MRILITGGAGFIGSHIAEQLLQRGDSILVIDNFASGRRDNLPAHPNLELVEGTIADPNLVERSFESLKPEIVIHAAASYKDPDNWEEDSRTNVLGTAIITQAGQRHNINRLIYFQTALCYGIKPLEQPISLSHPIRPGGSSYALSKTAGEQYIQLSGLNYITFRLANAYGPRNLSGPLPTFYHRLREEKPCFVMDTRRDFIYINDLVAVVMQAIDGSGESGAYHVATGSDYSIKELFDAALSAMEITLDQEVAVKEPGPDDAPTLLIDPTKTEQDFGWKASTQLATGVSNAIAWYETHGIEQTFTHLRMDSE